MTKAYHLDWEALVEEQRTSGWNMKKFCLEKGIPYQAFKNHKYAILDKAAEPDLFVPVKPQLSKELKFSFNGNLISFDADTDDETVSRILKALSS